MLLDRWVAEPEFSEHHERFVAASADLVHAAVRELTPVQARLLGPAAALRALPTVLRHPRLAGRFAGALTGARSRSVIELMLDSGFVELGETPGSELVVGVVGKLWTLADTAPVEVGDADGFARFAEPGFAKAALGFASLSDGGGARLVTETRVITTSADARERFARYWRTTLAAGGVIRASWLTAIERRAVGLSGRRPPGTSSSSSAAP